MSEREISDAEREVLKALWTLGLSPVRAIREQLESQGREWAHTTVGTLLSLILGHLIIYVINRQAFGWTLLFDVPWGEFAVLGLGLLAIGALAGHFTGTQVLKRMQEGASKDA